MKTIKNPLLLLIVAGISLFEISCDDNEEIIPEQNAVYDAVLEINEANPTTQNQHLIVNATTEIKLKVSLTSAAKSIKRLYITQDIQGEGETIYKPVEDINLNGDGSVEIASSENNSFDYTFMLPVPSASSMATGTVVYKFWATDGMGDFRDITKGIAVGPGSITLHYGDKVNAKAGMERLKKYSATILAPPLADSSSLTFISLFDGQVYRVKDGKEYAKKWDFGYWYGGAGASLASTAVYETVFPSVDVDGIAGTTDLNAVYFRLTTKSLAEFSTAEYAKDLAFTTVAYQNISGLVAGNVIEFIDNYGKKGLIYVVEVKGTSNPGDYIKLDIKIQP